MLRSRTRLPPRKFADSTDSGPNRWKIAEPNAPSPRGYLQLVNRWMREVRRQLRRAFTGFFDAADPERDDMREAGRIIGRLQQVLIIAPTPHEIEVASKGATYTAVRGARRKVVDAGVPVDRLRLRLGITDDDRVLGVDIAPTLTEQQALTAWAREGTDLIRSTGQDLVKGLDAKILDAARRGRLTEELRDIVVEQLGVSARHAQFIARDQISKLNGKITEATQQAAGVTSYRWRCANDGRVRPMHDALRDSIQLWSDPPVVSEDGRREHPGGDFQCRCWAQPVIDEGD